MVDSVGSGHITNDFILVQSSLAWQRCRLKSSLCIIQNSLFSIKDVGQNTMLRWKRAGHLKAVVPYSLFQLFPNKTKDVTQGHYMISLSLTTVIWEKDCWNVVILAWFGDNVVVVRCVDFKCVHTFSLLLALLLAWLQTLVTLNSSVPHKQPRENNEGADKPKSVYCIMSKEVKWLIQLVKLKFKLFFLFDIIGVATIMLVKVVGGCIYFSL